MFALRKSHWINNNDDERIAEMESRKNIYIELESELNQIFLELGMADPRCNRCSSWLKMLIMVAIHYPSEWNMAHIEHISRYANVTHERVRQFLWRKYSEGREVLCNHFGDSVEINFMIKSKPNAEEFVTLLADNLRAKYEIQPRGKRLRWPKVNLAMFCV